MGEWDGVTAKTVSDWAAAGQGGDAEAAFRLAGYALEHGQREAADGWMEIAARFGASAMLWRLADLVKESSSGGSGAAGWQRRAITSEWGGQDVAVDENTFRIFSMDPESDPTQEFGARVQGVPDDAVRIALDAAGQRFGHVGDDGVEYPDGEAALDNADYNPNYVSDPQGHPGGGWQFWMDCKGGIFPLMAATQLRILVEELRRAGVTGVRIGPREQP